MKIMPMRKVFLDPIFSWKIPVSSRPTICPQVAVFCKPAWVAFGMISPPLPSGVPNLSLN